MGVAAVAGWVVQSLVLPRCRAWVDAWQASRREAEEQRNKVGLGRGKGTGSWEGEGAWEDDYWCWIPCSVHERKCWEAMGAVAGSHRLCILASLAESLYGVHVLRQVV